MQRCHCNAHPPRRAFAACTLLLAGTAALAVSPAAVAANPTIEFEIVKAGLIIGGSGGSGTLTLEGKTYPLKIGDVSLGATIGISKAELAGEVLNLKSVSDIEGTSAPRRLAWRWPVAARWPS